MSCSICHYISGHADDCIEGLRSRAEDFDNDFESLRERIGELERKLAMVISALKLDAVD